MPQALIIEGNVAIGCELSKRLFELGFDRLDHVWTEEEAVAMAELHPPDLIVVGDEIHEGNGVEAARRICQIRGVPVLLVTRNAHRVGERLAEDGVLDGPYAFSKLPEAIGAARDGRQAISKPLS